MERGLGFVLSMFKIDYRLIKDLSRKSNDVALSGQMLPMTRPLLSHFRLISCPNSPKTMALCKNTAMTQNNAHKIIDVTANDN